MRVWLIVAILLAGCSSPSPPGDATNEDPLSDPAEPAAPATSNETARNVTELSEPYTGVGAGAYGVDTGCGDITDIGVSENVGGACFELPAGALRVDFEVEDDVSPDVGVYVRYPDGGGAEGFFCGSGSFDVDAGAREVVFVLSDTSCVLGLQPAAPSTGKISLTVEHP